MPQQIDHRMNNQVYNANGVR